MLARGVASGWVDWGGRRYDFAGAPAYAEKNWGTGFPKKWFWVQATGFDGEPDAALTSVGAQLHVCYGSFSFPCPQGLFSQWPRYAW